MCFAKEKWTKLPLSGTQFVYTFNTKRSEIEKTASKSHFELIWGHVFGYDQVTWQMVVYIITAPRYS